MSNFGVKQVFTTPLTPSSNGIVERFNKTLQGFLRSMGSLETDWDSNLTGAVITYNNTLHTELGLSPSTYILSKSHNLTSVPIVDNDKLKQKWSEGSPKFESFVVDSYVLMRSHGKGNLTINKFLPKYKGPLKISKVNSNGVTYLLQDVSNSNGQLIRAHHRDLLLYKYPSSVFI